MLRVEEISFGVRVNGLAATILFLINLLHFIPAPFPPTAQIPINLFSRKQIEKWRKSEVRQL